MNKENARKHIIKKCKTAINSKIESSVTGATNLIFEYEYDGKMCYKCDHEDFGYCGLRSSNISDFDRRIKYCLPSFLKSQNVS